MLVSIDVDAATDVVARIRAKVDYIDEQRSDVAEAGRQGLCSVSVLPQLGEHLNAILGLARDLETRIELAVLVNTGGTSVSTDGGAGGAGAKLSYEVTDDTITAVRGAIGAQIAERMRDLDPDGGDSPGDDVQELEELTVLLGRYGDDPQVMAGLFAELGPQGVVDVPSQLRRLADSCRQAGTFLFEADGSAMEEDPQARFEHLAGLQQRFMVAFGGGLALATRSEAFRDANPGFAQGLADQATTSPDWGGWGLSQVLRFGDYHPGFLVEVANGLYGWEKDTQAQVWTTRPSYGVVDWRIGTDDQGQYYDPFLGLFQAMGRNQVAGRDFLDPDTGGPQAQQRFEYFVAERLWSDDGDALGQTLEAATGTTTESMGHHSAAATRFTFDVITALAGQEFDLTSARDSFAAIAASYAPEMLAGANLAEHGTDPSTMTGPEDWTSFPGLEPGFYLSPEDTYAFLRLFGHDDGLSAPFDEAAGTLYVDLLGDAASNTEQFGRTAALFGCLAGVEYMAQKDVRGDMDAHDQGFRDAVSTVLNAGLGQAAKVTPQGLVAALAWKAAVWGAKQGVAAWREGDPEATRVALLEDAVVQASFLQEFTLCQILIDNAPERGATLPPELTSPGGGLIDPGTIAQDANLIQAFQDWIDHQDHDGVEGTTDKILEEANDRLRAGFGRMEDRFG